MVGLFARARRRALRRRRRLRSHRRFVATLSSRAPAHHQSAARTSHAARNCAAACRAHRWTPAAAMSAGSTRPPCTPATLHHGPRRQRSAALRVVLGLDRSQAHGSSDQRATGAAAAHAPEDDRGDAFPAHGAAAARRPRSACCRSRCRPDAGAPAVSCAPQWRHGETPLVSLDSLRCGGLRGKPPLLESSASAQMVLLPPAAHRPAEHRLAARCMGRVNSARQV
jgi:hypothetical protein